VDSDVSDDTKVAQFFEVFLEFCIPLFFNTLQLPKGRGIIAVEILQLA
jgi:hypothetical protein